MSDDQGLIEEFSGEQQQIPDVHRQQRLSQATQLVALAAEADLFHTPDGEAFATVPVAEHRETWPLKSKGFRLWLRRRYYVARREAPNVRGLQDALGVLESQALFEGAEHPVFVRVGESNDAIYVDLANDCWEAVEITAAGWRIVAIPPVKFCRTRGMLALPYPILGGTIKELRPFLNVASDADFVLLISWQIAALRARGPYPVLINDGEQGSAKSTTQRLQRALIDPNTAPLRAEPRDIRDLMIAARNGWIVALDNLSHLDSWLSDALCRLATGGGFGTRELYADVDEILFDAMRPVMLNGINNPAVRGDLLERAVILTAPSIPDAERRTEAEFRVAFEQARPRILGALLTAAAAALHDLPTVDMPAKPRMADFAEWAVAAAPALGWASSTFLRAYTGNRDDANRVALEASPVTPLITALAEGDGWSGTATDLLKVLNEKADETTRRQKFWPGSPKALSSILRRLAPNLRAVGVGIVFHQTPGKGSKKTIELREHSDAWDASDAHGGLDPHPTSPDATPPGANAMLAQTKAAKGDVGVASVAPSPCSLCNGPELMNGELRPRQEPPDVEGDGRRTYAFDLADTLGFPPIPSGAFPVSGGPAAWGQALTDATTDGVNAAIAALEALDGGRP